MHLTQKQQKKCAVPKLSSGEAFGNIILTSPLTSEVPDKKISFLKNKKNCILILKAGMAIQRTMHRFGFSNIDGFIRNGCEFRINPR